MTLRSSAGFGLALAVGAVVLLASPAFAADAPAPAPGPGKAAAPGTGGAARKKPVLQYNLYYHARGDTHYLPEGDYKDVLARLATDFDVRIGKEAPSLPSLDGVKLLLLATPNEKPQGSNPAPPRLSAEDAKALHRFLADGGGLIYLANLPDHNLELTQTNAFLAEYGIQQTVAALPVKLLATGPDAMIVRNLRWGFYGGCALAVAEGHPAKPVAWVWNDPAQKAYRPKDRDRDQKAPILAVAEAGKGRLAVVSDSTWLVNWALTATTSSAGALGPQDNWELLRRLARWTAGFADPEAPSE